MGQGLMTKVMQVAASVFGLPPDVIRTSATDTDKVPNTSATAASAGSDLNGMATYSALQNDTSPDGGSPVGAMATETRERTFRRRTRPDRRRIHSVQRGRTSLPRGAHLSFRDRVLCNARHPLGTEIRRGRPFYYFAYGAAVTEAVIDTLSGESRILRTDIVHDVGESLNTAIDIGQIEGGFVQGAGWLTTEELVWNENGRLLTHAPSTYKIPACSDRPMTLNVTLFENANSENTDPPFQGCRGTAAHARDFGIHGNFGRCIILR